MSLNGLGKGVKRWQRITLKTNCVQNLIVLNISTIQFKPGQLKNELSLYRQLLSVISKGRGCTDTNVTLIRKYVHFAYMILT